MEKENISVTEKKKNRYLMENIWRREIYFYGGDEERKRKRRNIIGERKYFFAEEKKNGEGKGGKFWENENIW